MHTNHRRKFSGRKGRFEDRNRWGVSKRSYLRLFWGQFRARQQHLMVQEDWDNLQDRIPRSILWDML